MLTGIWLPAQGKKATQVEVKVSRPLVQGSGGVARKVKVDCTWKCPMARLLGWLSRNSHLSAAWAAVWVEVKTEDEECPLS